MTNDASQMRRVPIEEAAKILSVSRRTVERRLNRGELSGQKQAGKWLVDVPVSTTGLQQKPDITALDQHRAQLSELSKENAKLVANVESLSRQIEELTKERDTLARDVKELTHQVEDLKEERGWLRQAHEASLTLAAQAQQQQQKLLTERSELAQPHRSSWLDRLLGRDKPRPPKEDTE